MCLLVDEGRIGSCVVCSCYFDFEKFSCLVVVVMVVVVLSVTVVRTVDIPYKFLCTTK